jgi:hypothetical protein
MSTAIIPAASAGRMSLSNRSPTYATSSGAQPDSVTILAKNAEDGFSTPSLLRYR